jgi:hypothetical protein
MSVKARGYGFWSVTLTATVRGQRFEVETFTLVSAAVALVAVLS